MASFGKVRIYPNGDYDIIAASTEMFDLSPKPKKPKVAKQPKVDVSRETSTENAPPAEAKPKKANLDRARSRARAKVRQLALANEFQWFVTLTLDPAKIDRYDAAEVVRKMSQWCDNRVRRKGLRYILVPEHHADGAIHFHGFFNGALEAVESGLTDKRGHKVYNLPDWTLGFTRAVRLYGEYGAAVTYVTKYIGKETEKIGGRWYYSGGALAAPEERELPINYWELMEAQDEEFTAQYGAGWFKATPQGLVAGINGMKGWTEI